MKTQPAAVTWNVLYQGKYARTAAGLTPVKAAFPGDGTPSEAEARARFAAAKCAALLVVNDPALKATGFFGWVVSRSCFTSDEELASMLVFQKSAYGHSYASHNPREDVAAVRRRRKSKPAVAERTLTASEAESAARSLSPFLSLDESVLFALYVTCARSGEGAADREVVALVCEELDSAKFSMRTSPGRLDTNRVYSKLARLLAAGRVENPAKRLYRLTSEGRALVARLGRSSTA